MMDFDKYRKFGAYHHNWYKNEPWYKNIIDFALSRVEGESVIDAGSGDGLFLKLATQKGLRATGCDADAGAIDLSKEFAPDADVFISDINLYDHKGPRSFDTMVCINTIEHLEKPEKVAQIFKDQVNKKMIIITDKPRATTGRYHFKEYTPEELIEVLGLKDCRNLITDLGDYYAVEFWK